MQRRPGHVARVETGRGPAVLLLPGWSGFKESWAGLPDALAAAGMRAVAVDLPGWGGSAPPPRGRHTPAAYAAALSPLVSELAPVCVVGYSMGVQTALALGIRHPDRIPRLALVSPAPAGGRFPPRRRQDLVALPLLGPLVAWIGITMMKAKPESVLLAYRASVVDPDALARDPATARLADLAVERFAATPTGVLARSLHAAMRTDVPRLARRVPQPSLVIVGERDPVAAPALVGRVAEALPLGHLETIPGIAHIPTIEAPELLFPLLIHHLRGFEP